MAKTDMKSVVITINRKKGLIYQKSYEKFGFSRAAGNCNSANIR
jgi:hypothetical protein